MTVTDIMVVNKISSTLTRRESGLDDGVHYTMRMLFSLEVLLAFIRL